MVFGVLTGWWHAQLSEWFQHSLTNVFCIIWLQWISCRLGHDSTCDTAHLEAVLVLESTIFSRSHRCYPSKHAGSDSPPIRSIGQKRSGWCLHNGLLPDRIRLAKPWHSQPGQIGSGLVWHSMIRAVCGRTQPSLRVGKLVAGRLRSARTGPDDSFTLACFRASCVWPKPDKAIQIGSGSVLHTMFKKEKKEKGSNRTREVRIRHIRPGPILSARWP